MARSEIVGHSRKAKRHTILKYTHTQIHNLDPQNSLCKIQKETCTTVYAAQTLLLIRKSVRMLSLSALCSQNARGAWVARSETQTVPAPRSLVPYICRMRHSNSVRTRSRY